MHNLSSKDIKYLKGVGEARAKLLGSEADIHTFRDLAYYFPFRYVDRSRMYRIKEFAGDMPAVQVKGRFVRYGSEGLGAKRRVIGLFSDGERTIEVLWFHRGNMNTDPYPVGKEYVLFGKPNLFNGRYSFVHPEIEIYNPSRPPEGMRGVYPLTEKMRQRGLSSAVLHKLAMNLLESADNISDTIPPEVVARYSLMPLNEALRQMHAPTNAETLRRARERMKLEEMYYLQTHILRYASERNVALKGAVFSKVGEKVNRFFSEVLPFQMTNAQKRVIHEIRNDMRTGRQMNRLLQGDVGSGKTMVAFMTMLIAVDNGCQACLMAPTEILARQHYETLKAWGDAIGVRVELLTGSISKSKRTPIHEGLRSGDINILVGTHALIEDEVQFFNLGLAVIDEQHRFGVAQRARLWAKNTLAPHVLVMTATPIPRTLAMTVYGDLDVSVIDELPPGRKPVMTLLRYEEGRSNVLNSALQQLREGRQIYVVYPLIHDNEKTALRSIEQGYEQMCSVFEPFGFKVCCVHGQMKAEEKDRQMQLFVNKEAHIMVATTVIEVGVNVPNASVMIIENAERFGLSQLHQLRGRVGRGADQSYCILMTHQKIAKDTRRRLEIMTETTDGFLISEADMKLRGPGDMEGTQQSGLAFNIKLTDLATDTQIVQHARDMARLTLDSNPPLCGLPPLEVPAELTLSAQSTALMLRELDLRFGRKVDWSQIS